MRLKPLAVGLVTIFMVVTTYVMSRNVVKPKPPVQRSGGPKILTVDAATSTSNEPDWDGVIQLRLQIESEFHINSNTPTSEFLIPTTVKFKSNPAVTLGSTEYPKGVHKKFSFSEDKLSIYEGRLTLQTPYRLGPSRPGGEFMVEGEISYQACTDKACLPPRRDRFEVLIRVAS